MLSPFLGPSLPPALMVMRASRQSPHTLRTGIGTAQMMA